MPTEATSLSNIPPYVQQYLCTFLSPGDVSVSTTCRSWRETYEATMAKYEKGLELKNVVDRSLWKANVYHREGSTLPVNAYVLPDQSDVLTNTQRRLVLQAALETARLAWGRFSKADHSTFAQVTPESCCRDPELFYAVLRVLDEITLVDMLKKEIPGHEDESRDLQMQALMKPTYLQLVLMNLQMLPESFGKLTALTWLNLAVTNLLMLPDSFGKLTALTWLNLARNNLQMLPKSFGELTALTTLYLKHNNLKTLPESLCNLNALQYLDVRKNKDLAQDKKSCETLAALRRRKPACKVLCDKEVEDEIEKILQKK
jgi:hypothetical protein